MIFFGQRSLTNEVNQFLPHYHAKRNHLGPSNAFIDAGEELGSTVGKIDCRKRLGGMLKYYHRRAA